MIQTRPAQDGDAFELAPKLRAADLQEIEANLGEDPLIVLERSIAISNPCYAVVDEADNPMALFGAAPDTGDAETGMVWLLGSNELVAHPFYVLRNSRKWVEKLHQCYKVLWNCVDARNEVHIRWLKWCGFEFIRLIEQYGVEQRPFYEFEKVRGGAGESPDGQSRHRVNTPQSNGR
jgi:hypothetical protein